MDTNLQSELNRFKALCESSHSFHSKKVVEYAYSLFPQGMDSINQSDKLPLTLMAVVHGNELAGIGVLNRFLKCLADGVVALPFPIQVVLANPWASLEGKRFVDRDLNRSFGRSSGVTREDQRAKDLEGLLANTDYLLDFHQTIEASHSPFFIFPYEEKGFAFARHLAADIPIVTHWGGGFSKDGQCSDEYVNAQGGVGITLELGQMGFDLYQESVGLQAALSAIATIAAYRRGDKLALNEKSAQIYTWAEIIPYPDGDASLDEGWYNFQYVEAGTRLGNDNGEDLCCQKSGPLLFPKYLRQADSSSRPKEICRVMKRVSFEELGKIS